MTRKNIPSEGEASALETLVLPPEAGEQYWQPVPANGYIAIKVAPHMVKMNHPLGFGTQSIASGCYVREHLHPDHDEIIHVLSGVGTAVIDGREHRIVPGTTVFIGKAHRHKFIAGDHSDLTFIWLITPNGLEEYFKGVGRPKHPHEEPPAPFPRPNDVGEIERRTVFGERT